MITGLVISFYYASQDLPNLNERDFLPSDISTLPLCFATAIFAFEGISLVLPLQNAMKEPHKFSKVTGVLNVGMTLVTIIFISFGMIGYWKYGDKTEGSLTLNLPKQEM
jgi:solute carrier family 36 (proton-coupled amino acid transporter)